MGFRTPAGNTHQRRPAPSPGLPNIYIAGRHRRSSLAWTLDTTPMDKCGYALILRGNDRTIINSNGAVVHSASKAVGFSVI